MMLNQTEDSDVITFLLSTEIIPLCLKIMDAGTELSKTVCCPVNRTLHSYRMYISYRLPHLSSSASCKRSLD